MGFALVVFDGACNNANFGALKQRLCWHQRQRWRCFVARRSVTLDAFDGTAKGNTA
jgi:hypothetical protein